MLKATSGGGGRRITSYNVCYTKLLRKKNSELMPTEPYLLGSHSGCCGIWTSGPDDVGAPTDEALDGVPAHLPKGWNWGYRGMTTVKGLFTAGDRITSYNVCYTKLLREAAAQQGAEPGVALHDEELIAGDAALQQRPSHHSGAGPELEDRPCGGAFHRAGHGVRKCCAAGEHGSHLQRFAQPVSEKQRDVGGRHGVSGPGARKTLSYPSAPCP